MKLLYHYLWQHQLLEEATLRTTDGRPVTLLHPGVYHRGAGPCFRGAKVRIGEEWWVGDVAIDLRASDWYAHGHDRNPAYHTTILHVVGTADQAVCTEKGTPLPQLLITPPPALLQRYERLLHAQTIPACGTAWQNLDPLSWTALLDRLIIERIEERMQRITTYLQRTEGDWERTFFVALARNFGFGTNGDAFEAWALALCPSDLAKHRDDPTLIEAYFLGMAGLLDEGVVTEERQDDVYRRLCRDFAFLRQKFTLTPLSPAVWTTRHLRPQGLPHVRIAQLVDIYCSQRLSLSALLATTTLDDLRPLLSVSPTSYWQSHYAFGQPSTTYRHALHTSSIDRLVINTIAPFLFTYGRTHEREDLCERAVELLVQIKAENDRIIRCWKGVGCRPANAAHTQALHHLTSAYCRPHHCALCPIGRRWLGG